MEDQNVQNLEPNTEAAPAAEAAANPLERKVTLRIPAERIANETQRLIKQYARSVKMPGFRPGKVPLKLVERMYGSEARSEALSKAIEKALTEAIQQGEYRVAGGYRIDPVGDEPAAEGEFVVEAAFEIYPEIEIVDLKEVEVVKPVVTVDDAAVERTIEVLRKQRATFVEVDRPAEKGDRVTVDFVGTLDGEPFEGGSATDYVYVIGESRLLPEFDTAPVGLKAGEKKTFDVTFPENYGAEHLAGKTAQFELTVKKVEAPQLPEVTPSSRNRSESKTVTSQKCATRFARASSGRSKRVSTARSSVKCSTTCWRNTISPSRKVWWQAKPKRWPKTRSAPFKCAG